MLAVANNIERKILEKLRWLKLLMVESFRNVEKYYADQKFDLPLNENN